MAALANARGNKTQTSPFISYRGGDVGKEDHACIHVLIHSPPWDMFIHSPDTFFTPCSHSSPVLNPEVTELVDAALPLQSPTPAKVSGQS